MSRKLLNMIYITCPFSVLEKSAEVGSRHISYALNRTNSRPQGSQLSNRNWEEIK
jgi:hypothetical protein